MGENVHAESFVGNPPAPLTRRTFHPAHVSQAEKVSPPASDNCATVNKIADSTSEDLIFNSSLPPDRPIPVRRIENPWLSACANKPVFRAKIGVIFGA
jgi:hypothetical protein